MILDVVIPFYFFVFALGIAHAADVDEDGSRAAPVTAWFVLFIFGLWFIGAAFSLLYLFGYSEVRALLGKGNLPPLTGGVAGEAFAAVVPYLLTPLAYMLGYEVGVIVTDGRSAAVEKYLPLSGRRGVKVKRVYVDRRTGRLVVETR